MTERTITVQNRAGVHARPAAMIVQTTKDFKCSIHIEKGENRVNAKSIMGLLTLGAAYGTELRLCAEGEDETEAVDQLAKLFGNKFEEE